MNEQISAALAVIQEHTKSLSVAVAAKLREATKLIVAEQEVYAAAGYPVKIANCYANMLHFIGELDPDGAGALPEVEPGKAVEL